MGYWGVWGKLKSKISWPCPFKEVGFCRLSLRLLCTWKTVAPMSQIRNTTTTTTSSRLQIPSADTHIEPDNDMYVDFGSFWIFCRKPPAYCTCRNKEITLKMPVLQIQLKVSWQSLFIHIWRESHACNLLVWKTFLLQIIQDKFFSWWKEREGKPYEENVIFCRKIRKIYVHFVHIDHGPTIRILDRNAALPLHLFTQVYFQWWALICW